MIRICYHMKLCIKCTLMYHRLRSGMESEPSVTPSSGEEDLSGGFCSRSGVDFSNRAPVSPLPLCIDEWRLLVRGRFVRVIPEVLPFLEAERPLLSTCFGEPLFCSVGQRHLFLMSSIILMFGNLSMLSFWSPGSITLRVTVQSE